MPFDGTEAFRSTSPAALIVDHMMLLLHDENHWMKSRMRESIDDGGYRYCLLGALRQALTSLPKYQRPAMLKTIYITMNTVISETIRPDVKRFRFVKSLARYGVMRFALIMQFNDDRATSYYDILTILRRTRHRLHTASCMAFA